MSQRLTHFLLASALLLSSEAWAIGLGDVRLDSALNEPLRAQIELLSATQEELAELQVTLASQSTFERYGLDRPVYLQDIEFELVASGRADGNYIRVRSTSPMKEPFLTFLVEASWSRGRLLREYTVLLDPPTFAPPAARQAPSQVTAPQRSTPADSGRIQRETAPAPAPRVTPTAPPATTTRSETPAQPVRDNTPYDDAAGGDYLVRRGDSLWGIASSNRPDSRLSMNQTMLAIYEANPQAFGGNINMLRAGARLRIPSADEIYRIDRGDAQNEVQRQYSAWNAAPVASQPAPPPPAVETRPSLTLVPPDEAPVDSGTGVSTDTGDEPIGREQQILDRIAQLEAADVPEQRSLIEIRDNELANLRQELADLRGEVYEPDSAADDAEGPFVEDLPDDALADDQAAGDEAETVASEPPADTTTVAVRTPAEPSIMERLLEWATSIWALIAAAVIVAIGVLFWFIRREGDGPDSWVSQLDQDDAVGIADDPLSRTETMAAPTREDESFVVVEQDPAIRLASDTVEVQAAPSMEATDLETDQFASIEDTFSSDTAINLDQSDPIAEADFHMAYGLYDQAADLINGALEIEPEREDLLTKLCEIYFVWGNRDAFVDAAGRLKSVSDGGSGDWDKIVIMGQQIAGDDAMFAGAGVTGVSRDVDLSFGSDSGETGILDMDFGSASDDDGVIDLSAEDESDEGIDFLFGGDGGDGGDEADDLSVTNEVATIERPASDSTVEMPSADATVESPTIEEQFAGFGGTAELPSISDTIDERLEAGGLGSDETAEIDLDDLGLDLRGLDETEIASLDDDDDDDLTEIASFDDLDATGTRELLAGKSDSTSEFPAVDPDATGEHRTPDTEATSEHRAIDPEATSEHRAVDPDATGQQPAIDPDASGIMQGLDLDTSASGMRLAADETGQNPLLDIADESGESDSAAGDDATEVGIDENLLDATGQTRVLTGDEATLLAPSMDKKEEFDFASTEALPRTSFRGDDPGATGELPSIGSTDFDLDLDDLTAALEVNEFTGDTVQQSRDDATLEQPGPAAASDYSAETQELGPDDFGDDLHEARTMTEVGTKLDLARAYVDMGDPSGARSILEEVLEEGDEGQRQQAQQLLDSLPS